MRIVVNSLVTVRDQTARPVADRRKPRRRVILAEIAIGFVPVRLVHLGLEVGVTVQRIEEVDGDRDEVLDLSAFIAREKCASRPAHLVARRDALR